MATLSSISSDIVTFRNQLSTDLDSSRISIQAVLDNFEGHTSTHNDFNGPNQDTDTLSKLEQKLQAAESTYMAVRSSSNRIFKDQGDVEDAGEISYAMAQRYEKHDFATPILPNEDKNIPWDAIDIDRFRTPMWDSSNDIVTHDIINELKQKFISEAAQLAYTEEQWELVLEKLDTDMDIESAKYGASGFISEGSFLVKQHMDLIIGAETHYHDRNKEAAEMALKYAQDNIFFALSILLRLENSLVDYNIGMSSVYNKIASLYSSSKGVLNDIAIDAFKLIHQNHIIRNTTLTKRDSAEIEAERTKSVSLYNIYKELIMSKWETESKRIEARLAVELEDVKLDEQGKQLIEDVYRNRLKAYYDLLTAESKFDSALVKARFNGAKEATNAYIVMSSSVSKTDIASNK